MVLETRSGVGDAGPVPEVELILLLNGPDLLMAVRRDAESDIERLEDGDPVFDGCRYLFPGFMA